MNEYKVITPRQVQKQLDKAPRNMRSRLQASIESLAREPRPPGCIKMSGQQNQWRVREGDWRIVYIERPSLTKLFVPRCTFAVDG